MENAGAAAPISRAEAGPAAALAAAHLTHAARVKGRPGLGTPAKTRLAASAWASASGAERDAPAASCSAPLGTPRESAVKEAGGPNAMKAEAPSKADPERKKVVSTGARAVWQPSADETRAAPGTQREQTPAPAKA